MGKSDKHLRDISGLLKIGETQLDIDLVGYWAEELEVSDVWNEILRANPLTSKKGAK